MVMVMKGQGTKILALSPMRGRACAAPLAGRRAMTMTVVDLPVGTVTKQYFMCDSACAGAFKERT